MDWNTLIMTLLSGTTIASIYAAIKYRKQNKTLKDNEVKKDDADTQEKQINLAEVSMPALTHLTGNQAFRSCTKLTTLSFPNLKNLSGNSVFQGCNRLISLYLMSTTMCTLGSRNALANGPFSSGGSGTIYVPASLLATYLANANWASFSARLSGI